MGRTAVSREDDPAKPSTFKAELISWAKAIAVALAVWIVLRSYLVEVLRLPGYATPRRDRVVVFRSVEDSTPNLSVVKRIIGQGGDTLQMIADTMYRNGQKLDEPYAIYVSTVEPRDELRLKLMRERQLATGASCPRRTESGAPCSSTSASRPTPFGSGGTGCSGIPREAAHPIGWLGPRCRRRAGGVTISEHLLPVSQSRLVAERGALQPWLFAA
jgi:hypothetical protein